MFSSIRFCRKRVPGPRPSKKKMRSRTAWTILVLAVVLIAIALMRFNLSALREPGSLETSFANWGTHFLIRRASRHGIPPRSDEAERGDEAERRDEPERRGEGERRRRGREKRIVVAIFTWRPTRTRTTWCTTIGLRPRF